jgi:hypothetical protein
MEEERIPESQSYVEPVPQPSLIGNVFKVFYEPTSVFPSLTKKTAWLVPFVIVILISAVLGHFVQPIMMEHQIKAQEKLVEQYRDQIPAARLAEIDRQFAEARAEAGKFKWYFPLIIVGLISVFWAVTSLIGWLTGNFVLGGKANFWIILNAVGFAALVGLLGDIVRDIMMISKGSADVFTGLGLLKSTVGSESFLFYLFRQIDLFTVWRIIVTCIGLGVVYKMKTAKFAYVIFPVWIVFICLVALANTFVGGTIIY